MTKDKEKNAKADAPVSEPESTPAAGPATSTDSGQAAPEASAVSAEELDSLRNQLFEAQNGWQRERADFTNYRRRAESDRTQLWSQAAGETIKKFLPVLDDLERALANRPADDAWAGGVELVARKFQSVLESEGVKRMEALGQPFDPALHEAIGQEETDQYESGTVCEVLQHGYLQGERVLRPALVKVAA